MSGMENLDLWADNLATRFTCWLQRASQPLIKYTVKVTLIYGYWLYKGLCRLKRFLGVQWRRLWDSRV